MATNTYVALASTTLTSTSAFIEFTGISGDYTDLVLVARIIGGAGGNDCLIKVGNGSIDTGNNYSNTFLYGSGSSTALTGRGSNNNYLLGNITSINNGEIGTMIMSFNNYSNTTTFKTALDRYNSNETGKYVTAAVGTWRNTSAINTIRVDINNNGTYSVGTRVSLYGIRAEGVSPTTKATGGAVYSDSTYYYHVFGASGTFIPTQSITADVLVIAGGGGGGGWLGGGGGAGGLLGFNSQSLNSGTSYTVTVGSGGAKSSSNTSPGSNGSDSQFASLTLVKGGGYGGVYTGAGGSVPNGNTGGSGGGGGGQVSATSSGGSATSGQGNAGGNTANNSVRGGGGGGAGAAGGASTTTATGAGGVGLSTYSSWGIATGTGENVSGVYYYAGGGSGGTNQGGTQNGGGFGGGGSTLGVKDGRDTSGGGGAGAQDSSASGRGGSGVVIVRYAK
jgi:hypothetical protein